MKYFLSFMLFVSCINVSFSQKVYAVAFTDTDDDIIGDGCTIDLKNVKKFFNRISASLGYQLNEFYFDANKFNVESYNSFIKNIKPTKNDVILFYVSSHGERSKYDKTQFPQIYMKGQTVSAYSKYEELKKLPHKTLLTVIDACNVIRSISAKESEMFAKTYKPDFTSVITANEKKATKKIFIDNKYDLIITSSQVGVVSLSTERGSVFTNNFISSFNYYLRSDDNELINIENILNRSHDYTLNETQRIYINSQTEQTAEKKPHYPVWELDNQSGLFVRKDASSKQFDISYTVKKITESEKKALGVSNDYQVVFNIETDPSLFQQIKTVRYFLHPTFRRSIVKATDRVNKYKYTIYIWGEFLLRSEITLNDGTIIDVAKDLELD